MAQKVVSLDIQTGIQKDGTVFDAPCYVDGLWCRFQRGRPKKMGGYVGSFVNASGISRGMFQQSQNGTTYPYSGFNDGLEYWSINNSDGSGSGPTTITMDGFEESDLNLWQFDAAFDPTGTGQLKLFAHAGHNLTNIDSTYKTRVLTGEYPGGGLSPVGRFTLLDATATDARTITLNQYTTLLAPGQSISGNGIPPDTKIVSALSVTSPAPLTTITVDQDVLVQAIDFIEIDNNISVSGGCVMLYPYLFVFGSNGFLKNCAAGDFNNWVSADSNEINIGSTKIVKGLPLRGGTTSPAGLFWSLDQLTRVTYAPQNVGTSTIFWRYDIISTQTSILSSQCVIENDGIYYWIGVDRFLAYNGVVQEIPNNYNINYFFDNLNYFQRQKVWASKVPRYNEIWWFYPHGDSEECNNAIIFNYKEKVWYDAGLNSSGSKRSAGTFSQVFRFPIWAGWEPNSTSRINDSKFTIWQHERGVNQIYLTQVNAIDSYFETNNLGWVQGGPGQNTPMGENRWIRLDRLEPDFVQKGEMSFVVTGPSYAQGQDDPSDPFYFDPDTKKIDLKIQRREMRIRFRSNVVNGDYFMGNVLIGADLGDMRGDGNP